MKRWSSVLLLPNQKIPERFQLGEETRVKPISNNRCIYLQKHDIVLTGQKLYNLHLNSEHQTGVYLAGILFLYVLITKTNAGSKGCHRKTCPQC